MNNFKKILVPLDGSKYSKKALQRACEMVHAFDSQIVLIYVVEKSIPVNLLDRKEYLQLLRKYGKKILSDANEVLSKNGISGKSLIKEGNIVNEIDKVIKEEKCNLVVVGNKGLGTVARFLLGSVSNKLSQSSSCSIMIVK
ncbi:universal stress protein [Nitrosopumilus adriaticus]|uniref:UspA domain-containing protein n=1 Tax=Nitrosopumilus adriaticus TaxID=1580092 RepID=A0A0D5C3L9_9ARCH|nr:universal stress protein [Nitrosopumilus adriaticus]AJW71163.1 UspA domain-containing protein [Nitrosopumilus adriaticus]